MSRDPTVGMFVGDDEAERRKRATMNPTTPQTDVRESEPVDTERSETLWYHFLAKGWECPGHDDSYESSSCIGAVYVG